MRDDAPLPERPSASDDEEYEPESYVPREDAPLPERPKMVGAVDLSAPVAEPLLSSPKARPKTPEQRHHRNDATSSPRRKRSQSDARDKAVPPPRVDAPLRDDALAWTAAALDPAHALQAGRSSRRRSRSRSRDRKRDRKRRSRSRDRSRRSDRRRR